MVSRECSTLRTVERIDLFPKPAILLLLGAVPSFFVHLTPEVVAKGNIHKSCVWCPPRVMFPLPLFDVVCHRMPVQNL